MEEVKLKISVDGNEASRQLKELSNATDYWYNRLYSQQKKRIGMIEQEEAVLKRLKEYQKKAGSDTYLSYQRDIQASEQRIKQYQTIGREVETTNEKIAKSGRSLTASVKGWATGFVTLSAAIGGVKAVLESTDTLSDKFAATLSGWKGGIEAITRAIANADFKELGRKVREAVAEGQRYTMEEEKISDAERAAKLRIDERTTSVKKLKDELRNQLLTETDRLRIGKEAEKLIEQNAADEMIIAKARYDNQLQNAAQKLQEAGYNAADLEARKKKIELFLKQDPLTVKEFEDGVRYNAVKSIPAPQRYAWLMIL